MRKAKERGEDTYVDLTNVAVFAELRHLVEVELQRRLGLTYAPKLHVVRFLGWGQGMAGSLNSRSGPRPRGSFIVGLGVGRVR
jgi:hypothetical protein